ncbi:MAG: helix-turn-helix domain-containing protein [Solirubrobacterales bacterium]|nr:helix-turn-helix domain-containing protein [Solirubrobacterales bacterium]
MTGNWGFFTNHAHVLICVAHDPGARLRDIANEIGITERSTHKILSQLVGEGYVVKERTGRRNSYTVQKDMSLKHPLVEEQKVGELLHVLLKMKSPKDRREGPSERRKTIRPG